MEKLIIRNDDVSPSSPDCSVMYKYIKEIFPDCEIWSCVNVFSKSNISGSVYPFPPFKCRPVEWFYNVDKMRSYTKPKHCDFVASHGLIHVDHAKIGYDAQMMSIVTSCKYLRTNVFVPPFNSYNNSTENICLQNGIKLIKPDEWLSLEHNKFNTDHKKWYFHSWRYKEEEICHQLKHGIVTTQL